MMVLVVRGSLNSLQHGRKTGTTGLPSFGLVSFRLLLKPQHVAEGRRLGMEHLKGPLRLGHFASAANF